MSLFKNAIKAVKKEIIKNRNIKNGQSLEDDFEFYLNENKNISIVEKTHSFKENGFIESNLNPDFKVRLKDCDFVFWVECKFRSSIDEKNRIDLKNVKQYNRYKKLKEPVFYLIDIHNEFTALINMDMLYPKMFVSYLKKFEFEWDEKLTKEKLLSNSKS